MRAIAAFLVLAMGGCGAPPRTPPRVGNAAALAEEEARRRAEARERARFEAIRARMLEEERRRQEERQQASAKSDSERQRVQEALAEAERRRVLAALGDAQRAHAPTKAPPTGAGRCDPGDPLCDSLNESPTNPTGSTGSAPEPAKTTVSRFPTLEAPDEVEAGTTFAVQVSLTESKVSGDVSVRAGKADAEGRLLLSLAARPAGDPWVLDVAITAPGFEVVGSNLGRLTLPPAGDSEPVLFRLKARGSDRASRGEVFATFWEQGRFLAKVVKPIAVHAVAVAAAAPALAEVRSAAAEEVAPAARARRLPAAALVPAAAPGVTGAHMAAGAPVPSSARVQGTAVVAHPEGLPPDLTVWIIEGADAAHPDEAQVLVQSPHLQPASGTHRVPADLQKHLESRYAQFSRPALRGARPLDGRASPASPAASKEQTVALLRGFGHELWAHAAPPLFRDALGQLQRKLGKRLRTIQIFTNSPRLPWELMIAPRPDGGETDFLGIEYMVARWHVGEGGRVLDRPAVSLDVATVSVLAPAYRGAEALPAQKEEVETIRQASPARFRRVDATLERVRALVTGRGDTPRGIVHFAGHGHVDGGGGAAPDFVIRLSDGELALLAWKGMGGDWGGAHPLVFFNACDVGRAERAGGFVDGWGPAVLETGASGYIGGLWPLGDSAAADFAARFYRVALDGHHDVWVADLVRRLRARFYDTGDPTYLAYVFYGDTALQLHAR